MKIVEYIGKGRRGTKEPPCIWAFEDQMELPDNIADVLLAEPHDFIEVKSLKKPASKPEKKEEE